MVPPVVATLGNFDGVHLGHQQIVAQLRQERDALGGGTLLLLSFYPHPLEVLRSQEKVRVLTPLRQKVELLAAAGLDAFALLHFTPEVSRLSAHEFIHGVLFDALAIESLVVGPDACVGHDREGTPEYLQAQFLAKGKRLTVLPFYALNGKKVSSGVIRRLIEEGSVDQAAVLLGRTYILDGLVVHGDRRGSTIGIPTANLAPSRQVLPALGVYAAWAEIDGVRHASVTNVGMRPTFGGSRTVVETHLMDYHGQDFYGERIKVHLVKRLRGEQKFQGIETLVTQIRKDMEVARCVLSSDD